MRSRAKQLYYAAQQCVFVCSVCNLAMFLCPAGERAGYWTDHRYSEPVHPPAAQRQTAACQQHRADRTDARGFILESKER